MEKGQNIIFNNISDNEIRVISSISVGRTGNDEVPQKKEDNDEVPQKKDDKDNKGRRKWWLIAIILIACVLLYIIIKGVATPSSPTPDETPAGMQEQESEIIYEIDTVSSIKDDKAFVSVSTDTINDVKLKIITPQGGVPELHIGKPDTASAVLIAQAADVRGDNGEIAGAFILKGELKSKGLSKLGFCSIVGNEITLGRQSETPLFERAIEEDGYFFRQYSLVSDGIMIDIKPKGKAYRRALCYVDGEIAIIESVYRESYHDFAQALADYGVKEAIALVGGEAIMYYRTEDGEIHTEGKSHDEEYRNINYIVWKSIKEE